MNRIISLVLAFFMLPLCAAAEEPQEANGSAPQSGVVYTKAAELSDGGYAAFDVGGFTFGITRGDIAVKESELTDGGLTVSRSNCFKTLSADGDGFYLTSEDPPGTLCYIYIDADGLLVQGRDVPDGSWTYGGDEQALFYTSGERIYYLNPSADGIEVSSENAALTVLYAGETAPGGGGHGGPDEKAEEIDDAAPVIISHPEAAHYVIEGSGYDAPVFSLEAQLPEGSDTLYFQWYIDGAEAGEPQEFEGDARSVFTAEELADRTAGVYRVYCEAYCYTKAEVPPEEKNDNAEVQEDAGEAPDSDIPTENHDEAEPQKHSTRSYETVFIVCTGVESNSFLTFSDVHQTFSNIGTAIEDIMADNEGHIPALIVCTGDWVNSVHYMGDSEEYYEKTRDELIYRMALQTGGIDTVYVSGNHDNGRAAAEATINAKLGAVEDHDGVGIIYDSRAENENGSAAENTGLIVIGINYENAVSLNGSSVVSADYAPVIEELEKTLEEIKENYSGELIVISAHLGLHTLGIQPESAQSGTDQWAGKNEYNADNSDKMVELLNEYAKGMDMIYFFGHDHSKGEREFLLLPGQTIVSTASYEDKLTAENKLNFAYGHAGYITDRINGVEMYSFVKWTRFKYTREARKADGEKTVDPDLTKTVVRLGVKKRSGSGSQSVRLATERPTEAPAAVPTEEPTEVPAEKPTAAPTEMPSETPVPTPGPERNDRFTDVKNTDWFYEPVYSAFADGLMNGVSETEFAPSLSVTRAMIVSVLYRLDGEKPVSIAGSFTDADYSDYYGNALRWAEENGIVNGYDSVRFAPHGSVTREQTAAMLFRYAKHRGADGTGVRAADYADSDEISPYAEEAVGWSSAHGILKGFDDNTVRPGETATRAQLALMLCKEAELIGKFTSQNNHK